MYIPCLKYELFIAFVYICYHNRYVVTYMYYVAVYVAMYVHKYVYYLEKT